MMHHLLSVYFNNKTIHFLIFCWPCISIYLS